MVQLAASVIIEAAIHLMRAAQWNAATDLLRAAATADPADQRTLALALAEVAVDQDFAQQTHHAPPALVAASQALGRLPDATAGWDLGMVHLRMDYTSALFGSDTSLGPEERDQTTSGKPATETTIVRGGSIAAELSQRAARLRDDAPDDGRRGLAAFYAGVIADNLLRDPEAAFAHYTAALGLGERASDDLLTSLALRHLGDHAHTAGDLKLAREQWERSTELRQKVGHLLGALAQQTLMAVLLRDEGDTAGSRALATEIHRWSSQLGLSFLNRQTAELMASDAERQRPARRG
ncbi:hypothetical protein [Kribbella swartbergensis]